MAAALLLAAVLSPFAHAELTQQGSLFVRFDGGISPHALPRDAPAPIAVRIEGTVRALGGARPPSLRRIKIALNRAGQLNSRGLPICLRPQIDLKSPAAALAACASSLVGSGGIVARTTLPDQPPATIRRDLLLFNSVVRGRRAVLGHVTQTRPVPNSHIIVFEIRRTRGTFGTVLTAEITPDIERHGYLKTIFLQLQRTYVVDGERRAYLSAACSAPAGVHVANFPFARASMTFDDGRVLTSTLTRSCRVR